MIPIGQWLAEHAEVPAWQVPLTGIEAELGDAGRVSIDQLIEEAFERGKLEAEAEFKAQLEVATAEARQRCEKLLDELRGRWLREHIRPIAEKLGSIMHDMETRLSDAVGNALKPFLSEAVKQHALDEFKAMVSSHLSDGEPCPVRLKAPKDLLDVLGLHLKQCGLAVILQEAGGSDVTLEAGMATFESQVAIWLAAIEATSDG